MTEPAATPPDGLELAQRCAAEGLRVLPIPHGRKHPTLKAWQDAATTDAATIAAWWSGLYAGHGLGLAPDQLPDGRWWFVVDIDQHGVDGAATWADLCDAHDGAPETVEATTGGGGAHLLFASPTEIRNGRLGDGIDIRGHGGQIVVEPTMHPSGQPYCWVDGSAPWERPIADAPRWLLAMLAPEPVTPERPALPSTTRMDRPGDVWAASTTWDELLTRDGWTYDYTNAEGESFWVRPGKDKREGASATTGYKGSDVLKVFTTSMSHAGLHADETYTKMGYLAATRYGGDFSATRAALEAQGYGTPAPDAAALGLTTLSAAPGAESYAEAVERGDWSPVDLSGALAGHEPPMPTVLCPSSGPPLFYEGRINSLFGESGTGKTWVALAAIVEAIQAGHNAMLIDLEDTPHGIVARLSALGLSDDQIAQQFDYVAPQTPWSAPAREMVAELVAARRHRLIVIDSTGEAMAMGGVKGNNDDEVASWFRHFPRFLADLGPAVLVIDHIPKASDAPQNFAIGSQRKLAAPNGAAYRVDAVKVPSKVDNGLLKIVCAKDRHGNHTKGQPAAMVHIDHQIDGSITVALTAPEAMPRGADGVARPTIYMEKVSRAIESTPKMSRRDVVAVVGGKDKYVSEALGILVAEGYVEAEPRVGRGGGFVYTSATPYRDDMSSHDMSKGVESASSEPRPNRGQPRPEAPGRGSDEPRPHAPSPTGQGRGSAPAPDVTFHEPRPADPGRGSAADWMEL